RDSPSVEGTLTDSSGAPLASIKVVLRTTASDVKTMAPTDTAGFFTVLRAFPVGLYEQIRIETIGKMRKLQGVVDNVEIAADGCTDLGHVVMMPVVEEEAESTGGRKR
ncbi:carboxypeptidase-like regulatory domain-containing protein, partial [Candidatus Hydrogenedentota bacterium]